MARSRNIKPGFFTNEYLAELQPFARLAFVGLWTIADREGRLEDRPKKIKAEILPYDDCDMDKILDELANAKEKFVIRYEVDGSKYIQIANFKKHQNPHIKETPSVIPIFQEQALNKHHASTVQEPEETETSHADSLIPHTDSLIPHVRSPESEEKSDEDLTRHDTTEDDESEIQSIIKAAEISVYQEKERNILTETIKSLYKDKDFAEKQGLSLKEMRDHLKNLKIQHCDRAIAKMSDVNFDENSKITNPEKYFMKVLYKSILEGEIQSLYKKL